jgi:hypothetical protein
MDFERLSLLPTEARNPRSERIDQLSTVEMLRVINDEDATVAAAVREALPLIAEAVDAISARFHRGGRLFYVGAGTSGRLGVLDASECPPTFSVPPGLFVGLIAGGDGALRKSSEGSEDSPQAGAFDLKEHAVTESDSVVGIAASGRTPYVLGALGRGRGTRHRTRDRPGGSDRIDADEGRHGDEDGAQYAFDGRDDPARRCARQPDGERAAYECEAGGSGAEDHQRGYGMR